MPVAAPRRSGCRRPAAARCCRWSRRRGRAPGVARCAARGPARHHLDAALRRPARRALLDGLHRAARPARRRPLDPARTRPARLRRARWPASTSRTCSTAPAGESPRPRPGPATRRRDRCSGPHVGRGRRRARRRVRRSAGAATALPVSRWHDARRPGPRRPPARPAPLASARRLRRRATRYAARGTAPPARAALLETLEAYLAAGGRKAEAARRVASRAPVAVPAAAPGSRRRLGLARRRGRRARPTPGRPRDALPPRHDGPSPDRAAEWRRSAH